MVIVNTHEAKTRLSALLAEVEQRGETVEICRNGRPVARLVPLSVVTNPLRTDPELRPLAIHGDLCAPVDEEDWPEEWR